MNRVSPLLHRGFDEHVGRRTLLALPSNAPISRIVDPLARSRYRSGGDCLSTLRHENLHVGVDGIQFIYRVVCYGVRVGECLEGIGFHWRALWTRE